MEEKITALYCRLSQEDLREGESGSIQNQKIILQRYADEHNFTNTRFFVDDGFSGVSFDREGLNEMLKEVERGRVSTVITKDLSRLGRNYLKTGELIETVFPENGVRYIAVSDGVDTAVGDDDFTPLRNWFNEFYARDTSKKIRAVKSAKARRGERVNGAVPYGYLADPSDRNHLVPDPEAAPVVRKIFALYAGGSRICDIQRWLRDNRIVTASNLRRIRAGKPEDFGTDIYNWSDKTIYDIVSRREYLGHTITGKSSRISYKCAKKRVIPESERYFFPDTHEPLIDEETFALAQKRSAARTRPMKMAEIDIFSGLLFCGGCGAKMHAQRGVNMSESRHSYTCGAYRSSAGKKCTAHYIRKTVLSQLVLSDLQRALSVAEEKAGELIKKASELAEREEQKRGDGAQLLSASRRIRELDTVLKKLYEDYALEKIPKERFFLMSAEFEEERARLSERARRLEKSIDGGEWERVVKNCICPEKLTYENLHELVDRVIIHETDKESKERRIEIVYNFIS